MTYYEKYVSFTQSVDCGGLIVPSDNACQWTIFCFTIFALVKDKVCGRCHSIILLLVSETYSFQMLKKHALRLSNIYFKIYSNQCSPSSTEKPKQKTLKLSNILSVFHCIDYTRLVFDFYFIVCILYRLKYKIHDT